MAFPFKDINKCRLTCIYGKPGTHWASGKHDGVDLVSDGDKTVISVCNGTVIRSKYTSDGWGQYVVVRMADGRSIVYGHLVKDRQKVCTGDTVKVGQVIGTMGNTGNSSGAHLHIELQKSYYLCGRTDDITNLLGIKNEEGKVKKLAQYETINEVLEHWAEAGIIDTPEYWQKAISVVKNLDKLLIKIVNHYE